jgi:hypothetical protein
MQSDSKKLLSFRNSIALSHLSVLSPISSTTSQIASPLPKPPGKLPTLPTIGKSVTREAVEPVVMQRDKESRRRQMLSSRGISHSKDILRRADREDHLDELHQILGCPKDVWHMPGDIESLRQLSLQPCLNTSDAPSSLRRRKFESSPDLVSLGVPSGRRDAEVLASWLEGMQRQLLEKSEVSLEELFEDARLVYTMCFKELVRQVSVHCVERGKLVGMVWKGYLGLLERALAINIQRQQEINQSWEDKLNESEKRHKITTASLEKAVARASLDKVELERATRDRVHLTELHEAREERLMERMQTIQKHYESVRVVLMELKEDNRILKVMLHNAQECAMLRQPSLRMYKRKTSQALAEELMKDPLLRDMAKLTDEDLQKPDRIHEEVRSFGTS